MKKTVLTALCLAMGVSFALAQTNATKVNAMAQQEAAISRDNTMPAASYKGSIFAKDGELMNVTFSAAQQASNDFTTGVITTSTVIGSDTALAHTQNLYHAKWQRWNDTTGATLLALRDGGLYPVTLGTASGWSQGAWKSLYGFNSTTPMDGIMYMSMQDQIADWGGSGNIGFFDAYIAFPAIDASSAPILDINLYQYYRKFNSDRCYIDYSTDGTTWNAVEFNVKNVDVSVNRSTLGSTTITLPPSASVNNLQIRVRWTSTSNRGGCYGYFWWLDDVTVTSGENSRMRVVDNKYMDGFYKIMPTELQLPMVWYLDVRNNGVAEQNNIKGTLYTFNDANGSYSNAIATGTTNTLAALAPNPTLDTFLYMDPFGLVIAHNGWTYNGSAAAGMGSTSYLPTNFGTNAHGYFYGNLTSTLLPTAYSNGKTFDTVSYLVSDANQTDEELSNTRIWGRDNGALRKFSAFRAGLSADGYITTEPNETGWNTANYNVSLTYQTGATVPEGWVIRGVQIVPATSEGLATEGAKLLPTLTIDSVGGDYIYFLDKTESAGASVTTVTSNNLMSYNQLEGFTYETLGNYPVINLMFPNQPELKPFTNYGVGYKLVENASFCVATSAYSYYKLSDTSAVYFDTTPGMEPYRFGMSAAFPYHVRVFDPNASKTAGLGSSIGWSIPMVRMLVGPRVQMSTFNLNVQCGDNGEILDANYNSICGRTLSVVKGATNVYYAQGNEGETDKFEIDSVFVDGNWVNPETNPDVVQFVVDENSGAKYAIITLANIQADHTIRAVFKKIVGIDLVAARVNMKLQPNPATSNVQLSIEGVSGMVNYSLIDMSGRIINSARINAESVKTIDVSNLAKGAYFVRITNDKMSKVEKLIVH
ncbi:MAG: T9SS type A sorting domain-containing protein [Bacteroidales bacterium]|nr:T9SS type A sorting domain-containing protein [Bacteroidales bacterium]